MCDVADSEHDQVVGSLARLLEGASGGRISFADIPDYAEVSLRSLGLDSIVYVSFIHRIEESFSLRWQDDAPSEVFETLRTLADYLIEYTGPEVNSKSIAGVGPSLAGGGASGARQGAR